MTDFPSFVGAVPVPKKYRTYVHTGGYVTWSTGMTVSIAPGIAVINGQAVDSYTVAGYTIAAADATNQRIDTAFVSAKGFTGVATGIAGAKYSVPINSMHAVLANIYVPANATALSQNAIHNYERDIPFPDGSRRPYESLQQSGLGR